MCVIKKGIRLHEPPIEMLHCIETLNPEYIRADQIKNRHLITLFSHKYEMIYHI